MYREPRVCPCWDTHAFGWRLLPFYTLILKRNPGFCDPFWLRYGQQCAVRLEAVLFCFSRFITSQNSSSEHTERGAAAHNRSTQRQAAAGVVASRLIGRLGPAGVTQPDSCGWSKSVPLCPFHQGCSGACLWPLWASKQRKTRTMYGCTIFRGIPARGGGVHTDHRIKSLPD